MEPTRRGHRHTVMRMGHVGVVRRLVIVAAAVALSACAATHAGPRSGGGGNRLTVTVSTGLEAALAQMPVGNGPVAHYFPGTHKIVYVSVGLYSSTCPPRGTAAQDGATITLTVEDSDGTCTADAVRDTFQIEQVAQDASRLVIHQAGQRDIHLNLASVR